MARLRYLQRIFQAYLGGGTSQLSFWHETPTVNEKAFVTCSRQFYMPFHQKARYAGPFDDRGVPLLDYRGALGKQYNPIALAQYGLGCWNLHLDGTGPEWRPRFLRIADWLVDNLQANPAGLAVWMHHFDWEYFRLLRKPWYSGLAQGQGLALLVRACQDTGNPKYAEAAERAFQPLVRTVAEGGTKHVDAAGDWWIEEYITDPPTHILNGFLWALWGVYDYHKSTGSAPALELWTRGLATLEKHLGAFDIGHWSLYDLSPTRLRNVASPFYHALHLVQLEVVHRLTGKAVFGEYLRRWTGYRQSVYCQRRAWIEKAAFKLLYF